MEFKGRGKDPATGKLVYGSFGYDKVGWFFKMGSENHTGLSRDQVKELVLNWKFEKKCE